MTSDLVFLRAFLALQAKQHVSVSEAPAIVAGGLDSEFTDGLKGPQALTSHDRCLASVLRLPVDLRLGVRLKDREQHRVPRAVIDDCLRRRAAHLRAGAERFKFFDLAEIENLRACSGLKARIKQRQQRCDVYRNLTFHGHHLTASMIRPGRSRCRAAMTVTRSAFNERDVIGTRCMSEKPRTQTGRL